MRFYSALSLAVLQVVVAQADSFNEKYNTLFRPEHGDWSDADRTFEEIANNAGFRFEEHSVTTDDGYILALYRIPGFLNEESDTQKPPVMFQHGLTSSAYTWINNYADVAPAFVAARAGYDVWLGNNRGNTFSRKHETLDPDVDKAEFWDFTWYEMGTLDQPAFFNYINSQTNNQKIAYIGHSEGTTQMFTALAEMEDSFFGERMSLFVALGPVAKIPNTEIGLVQLALNYYDVLARNVERLQIYEIEPYDPDWVLGPFCTAMPTFCTYLSLIIENTDPALDDPDREMCAKGHSPNGASVYQFMHYAQNIIEDRFQVWAPDYSDYFAHHKKKQTDLIPLESIKQVPVAIFCGTADPLADCTDAQITANTIGDNVVHFEEILAGHSSFNIGKDMSYFTDTVMGLLAEYQPLTSTEFLQ